MISQTVLENVVPIGIRGGTMGAPITTMWIGTGFLVKEKIDNAISVFLITNKHVIQNQTQLLVRINAKSLTQIVSDITVPLLGINGAIQYSYHPNQSVDIVAVAITNYLPAGLNIGFDLSTECLKINQMKDSGIGEGDIVYALGYPMNLVDNRHSYPICRMGCISRIASSYDGLDPINYIVDAQTFPGNSGGPIVVQSRRDNLTTSFSLIGILHRYITYQEVLFSMQTNRQRSTMEENSGLTIVHPADRIIDVIKLESSRVALSRIAPSASL